MQQGKRPWRVALGALLICGCGTTDDPGIESEADGEGGALSEHDDELLFHWRRWPTITVSTRVDPEGAGSASVRARRPGATCEAEQCEVALWGSAALTAVAAPGYHFLRWSGCSDSSDSELGLRFVHRDTECVAHFAPNLVIVTTTVANQYRGIALIEVDGQICGQACEVPYGTTVTLISQGSSESYRFVGWASCTDSTEPVTELVVMTTERTLACVAVMEPNRVLISASVAPEGGGTVQVQGRDVDFRCEGPTSCQIVVGNRAAVVALPDAGYRFVGWTGCAESSETPLVLTAVAEQPQHCEAHFEPSP